MEKSIEFLKSLNTPKDGYIIVGCSGGPDSMCLLNLLYENRYKIICAHVNHNIRKESAQEYKFLKKYCKGKNIIFEGLELDKIKNKNEEFYRRKRYEFYKDLADKYNTNIIATAHHGDDLIETVLMRISRGSNLKGYFGFSKKFNEHGYIFIKPLIFYTKDDILEYNEARNIPFVNDKTNDEDAYTRNRYRHYILPFLKSENINIHKKYLRFSEELEDTSDYINSLVMKEMENNYKNGIIDLEKFNKLDNYIKRKELECIFSNIYGDDINSLKHNHIINIINMLDKNNNFTLNFPKNVIVKREYDKLIIRYHQEISTYNLQLNDKTLLPNGDLIEIVDDTTDNSNFIIRLNKSDIAMPLYVRTRSDGDKIEIKNLNGHKKVKSIFIDEKISPDKRMEWPILEDANNTVLWIPGLRKSKFDIKKEEKCDIILKYTRKEQINEEK